jgi:FdhE protein
MRVARAQQLARQVRAAREPLEFYIALATLEASLLEAHGQALRREAAFAEALDTRTVAGALPELLWMFTRVAPAPLARAARDLLSADSSTHRVMLERYWDIPGEQSRDERMGTSVTAFIAEAALQPFAEAYAQSAGTGAGRRARPRDDLRRCSVCGDRPVVAVLREQGHGARRSVVCGFCLAEWVVPRAECVWCGETRFEKLSNYRADEFPGAAIATCESCRTYIKTIDCARDGTAVPVVDDLATVALDIWAREQGYTRGRPNLLRL